MHISFINKLLEIGYGVDISTQVDTRGLYLENKVVFNGVELFGGRGYDLSGAVFYRCIVASSFDTSVCLAIDCREQTQETLVQSLDLFDRVLDGVDLQGENLQAADLEYTILALAQLQGVNLQNANMRTADLYRANLVGANLQGANLEWAVLEGANLQGANLQGANLQNANLQSASLQDANLEGANLEGANFRDAYYTDRTQGLTSAHKSIMAATTDLSGEF